MRFNKPGEHGDLAAARGCEQGIGLANELIAIEPARTD
jgi:hypothetical protein